jgi:hypothetical protein
VWTGRTICKISFTLPVPTICLNPLRTGVAQSAGLQWRRRRDVQRPQWSWGPSSFLQYQADHSLPSNAEVKTSWSYTAIPQYVFVVWCLIKPRNKFKLPLFGPLRGKVNLKRLYSETMSLRPRKHVASSIQSQLMTQKTMAVWSENNAKVVNRVWVQPAEHLCHWPKQGKHSAPVNAVFINCFVAVLNLLQALVISVLLQATRTYVRMNTACTHCYLQ